MRAMWQWRLRLGFGHKLKCLHWEARIIKIKLKTVQIEAMFLLLPRPLQLLPLWQVDLLLCTATIRTSGLHNYIALLQSSRCFHSNFDARCFCSLHFNVFAPFPARNGWVGLGSVGLGSGQRVLISDCFRTKDCVDLKIYAIISLCWHSVWNSSQLQRLQISSATLFACFLVYCGSTKNTVFSSVQSCHVYV